MTFRPDPKPEKVIKPKYQYRYTRKPTGEKDLFLKIWAKTQHVSYLSGRKLDKLRYTPFFISIFAHVLSKKQYPEYRLYEKCIILLHPEEHTFLDGGTEDQRKEYAQEWGCDWSVIYELEEELKKQYPNI